MIKKIYYIHGIIFCGSTKYGEYLCEKFNEEGKKSLFIGESYAAFSIGLNDRENTDKICSCMRDVKKCNLWKNRKIFHILPEAYKFIIDWANKKGYEIIIDSSKTISTPKAYQELGLDVDITFLWKPHWEHKKSMRKRGRKYRFNKWMIKNFLEYRKCRNFDVKGIYNEHKHIFGSNRNKFYQGQTRK